MCVNIELFLSGGSGGLVDVALAAWGGPPKKMLYVGKDR